MEVLGTQVAVELLLSHETVCLQPLRVAFWATGSSERVMVAKWVPRVEWAILVRRDEN